MEKEYIAFIDMGFDGLSMVEKISSALKHEDLLYINDYKHAPYDLRGEEEVLDLISQSYEKIKNYNIKLLIILSDTICEVGQEYFSIIETPIIYLVDSTIKFINKYHNQKNILLLSRKSIIESNYIQNNLEYNHLYTVEADKLINILSERLPKTAESFNTVNSLVKNVSNKDIDYIYTTSPFLENLRTEFKEYLKKTEFINISEIMVKLIETKLTKINKTSLKNKGSITLIGDPSDQNFKERCNKFVRNFKIL